MVFQIGCFRFSDLDHKFKKLTRIDFFKLFFLFHHSTLFILKNGLHDFFLVSFQLSYFDVMTWTTCLVG